ncbi:MAG: DNA-binding protein [Methylocella sp.]
MPELLEGFLTELEFAHQIGRGIRTVQRWRQLRIGPPVTKIGKSTYIRVDSAKQWLQAQERETVRAPKKHRRQVTTVEAAE